MVNRKSRKELITTAVLGQLPNKSEITLTDAISTWWFVKSGHGLRLTAEGDLAFRLAEIEFFDLPLKVSTDKWYSFIIDAGRKISCPYYIGVNKKDTANKQAYIRLYDSKIAMMVTLYGDIYSYLESVKVSK